MGSIGLMAFAVITWQLLPRYSVTVVLAAATLAWFAVSLMMWLARRTIWRHVRLKLRKRTSHHSFAKELPQSRRSR